MGTCEFFPALQGIGVNVIAQPLQAQEMDYLLCSYPFMLTADLSGVLSFGFGTIAMYLGSGRDL